ncbi:MAG TPA: hypothetical protein VE616_16990 [Candidatus Udaeobacter sp.]|jgi:hypothetical protein|nr:hypothetical protein [Candidatus Udaeobacter sp.]
MRLWLSSLLFVVLVVGGLPRLCWGDYAAEVFGDDNPSTFTAEPFDGRDDDRIAGSMMQDFHGMSFDNSLPFAQVSPKARQEPRSSKDDLRIYTVNRAFLI